MATLYPEGGYGNDDEAAIQLSSDSENRFAGERSIQISGDALKSTIVSGDGNTIIVVHYQNRSEEATSKFHHLTQEIDPTLVSNIYKGISNPYKRLDAFQVEDAERFFGREKQIERFWGKFRKLQEESSAGKTVHRLLTVLGPSGCGKSSLVRAGFIPDLLRRPLPIRGRLQVSIINPDTRPLESLALALARMATGDPSPIEKCEEFERQMSKSNDGFRKIAKSLPQMEGSTLLLLVDQFEETFSLCKDVTEQMSFVENLLAAALDSNGIVSVLLCLRSDFLEATYRYSNLNQVIVNDRNHLIVPVMSPEELRRAIQCPAELAVRSIENPAKLPSSPLDLATVNLLIEQAEDREGVLPLLQFALSKIWEGLQNGKEPSLTLQDLRGVGGALSDEANRIFDDLEFNEKVIARRIFLGLVQLGEGTKDTRRRVEISKLLSPQDDPKIFRQVINRFSDPNARLITLSSSGSGEKKVVTAEVTHEALFEHWQLLGEWIDNQRDAISEHRKIEASSEHWKNNGKRKGYLLQGQPLKDVERYQKEKAIDLPLSVEASEFFIQSRKKRVNNRLHFYSLFLIPLIAFTLIGSSIYTLNILSQDVSSRLVTQKKTKKQDNTLILELQVLIFLHQPLNIFKLEHAILDFATLNRANLYNAQLVRTSLKNAKLRGADLRYANLNGADLNYADFTGANLSGVAVDEKFTTFFNTNLDEVKLRGGDLNRADFRRAILRKADLEKTNFQGAFFTEADFNGAILNEADFRGAYLIDVKNLTKSQLDRAILCQTTLSLPDVNGDRDCKK